MHPLNGARERLDRADESIRNLNAEIDRFLVPAPVITMDVDVEQRRPIVTDPDREAFEELKNFIRGQVVPPRMRVLTGEIIHHLRSAFDHVAWQLSSADFQANSPNQVEFPVFKERPELCGVTKNKISRYCRKIQGIASSTALARIDSLQPYHRTNPSRDSLWLIHDMDRIDKHRELVLAVFIMKLDIQANATAHGFGVCMPWEKMPRSIHLVGPPDVKMKVKMSAQITLGEFSGREDLPLIPTLHNLLTFTVDSIESFAEEFA